MEKINGDNLCIDKTFMDFMESVKKEVECILNKNKVEYTHPVILVLKTEKSYVENDPGPAGVIFIKSDSVERTWFSIANMEFEHEKDSRKGLRNLAQIRFIDCLYFLEDQREKLFEVLKQFDPEWETPNDYAH